VDGKLGDSSMSEALIREEVMGLVSSAREIWIHGPLIDSEAPLRRALQIVEGRLGSEDSLAALVHVNLGWLASRLKRFDEANESFAQSLTILKQQFQNRHPDSIQTMFTLASIVGNYDWESIDADELVMALINAYESAGRDDESLGKLYELAALRRFWTCRLEEAAPLFLKSLAMEERWLGSDHLQTARTTLWIAMMHHRWGIEGDPEPYFCKALTGFKVACGDHHIETIGARLRFARFLSERKRFDEAAELLDRATKGLARHVDVLDLQYEPWMLDECCRFLQLTGRESEVNDLRKRFSHYDGYLATYRKNAKSMEERFGANSLELANELVCLAIAYSKSNQDNMNLAEAAAIRSITIYENHYGTEHEDTVELAQFLAWIRDRIQLRDSRDQAGETPSKWAPGSSDDSQGKQFGLFTTPWRDERRNDLVRTYLKDVGERQEDDPTGAIGAIIFMTVAADLDEQWEIVLDLIEQAPEDDHVLGNLAAGPLEGLLGRFDGEAIDRVEEKASQDPRFRRVLSGVWQLTMSDSTWRRVQAIQRTEPNPLPAYHEENDKEHAVK